MTTPEAFYREAIDLNRYSNKVQFQIASQFNEVILDVLRQIRDIEGNSPAATARLRSILAQMVESLKGWENESSAYMIEELQNLAEFQVGFVQDQLQKVIPQGEYPGCMDTSACNFNNIANIDDGSCLYNDNCCNDIMNVECNACNACQTPEDWCLNNPGFSGCDEYDVVGCMDDGLQSWSPFPGIAADNYAIGANTPCENCCAYWGCGNPDNSLMLVGTFMDLSGENGWNGTSMTVLNIWEDSQIYEMYDTVFYFSPSYDIMYELPPVPSEIGDLDGDGYDDADCCGLIDQSEFFDDGSENPNFGGPLPDGEVNHDDCLECPLNNSFVGELGYVVNFCAPEDLLDGCYQLIVDDGDPQQVAWQIQNADISVFAFFCSCDSDNENLTDPLGGVFSILDFGII